MKRVIASLFGTVAGLVMLLGFKTHSSSVTAAPAQGTTGTTGTTGSAGTSGTSNTSSGSSGSSSSSTSKAGTSSTSGTKTYTGDPIDTRWGPVQVQITVSSGKITRATTVVYPTENPRDQEINSSAVPTLQQETVSADSANIDMVSGATYTSTGYIQSLQSALNKAGL